jgi:hypothetical protein
MKYMWSKNVSWCRNWHMFLDTFLRYINIKRFKTQYNKYPVGICLLERMEGRGTVNPPPGTPFHADFNELLFVSIALTLMEISLDCDRNRSITDERCRARAPITSWNWDSAEEERRSHDQNFIGPKEFDLQQRRAMVPCPKLYSCADGAMTSNSRT